MALWQAIANQLQSGRTENAAKLWPFIIDYVGKVPRQHIPFTGLFWDTDEPELFRQQWMGVQLYTPIIIWQRRYLSGMVSWHDGNR